jgi:hypothetical protein
MRLSKVVAAADNRGKGLINIPMTLSVAPITTRGREKTGDLSSI